MVDDGILQPVGAVAQLGEFLYDFGANLVEVGDGIHGNVLLHLDGVSHGAFHAVDQRLESFGHLEKKRKNRAIVEAPAL